MVLLPLLALADRWLSAPSLRAQGGRSDWIDGVLTTGAMLVPLALAFQQIQMLQRRLPPPSMADLFNHRADERLAGRDPGGSRWSSG